MSGGQLGKIEGHAFTGGKTIIFEHVQIENIAKHAFYFKSATQNFALLNNNITKMDSEIILSQDLVFEKEYGGIIKKLMTSFRTR